MSNPIHLFDSNGDPLTLYAPTYAKQLVEAGELFTSPPALPSAPSIDDLSLDELRAMAKERGVARAGRMKRETLLARLADG